MKNYMPTNWTPQKKTDKFLEAYNFPKLNQKEIENLNRPITSNDVEFIIKKTPPNPKNPGPGSFTREF